ncbi:MAG: flavodoxin family protein [Blautia sp.]
METSRTGTERYCLGGSPVCHAGPSGQLTAFLDRLFYSGGGRMAGKLGASVVSCRRGGASAAFDRLNKYFTISSMPVAPSRWLESGTRIYAGRCEKRRGRTADHAYFGREYGMAAEMH